MNSYFFEFQNSEFLGLAGFTNSRIHCLGKNDFKTIMNSDNLTILEIPRELHFLCFLKPEFLHSQSPEFTNFGIPEFPKFLNSGFWECRNSEFLEIMNLGNQEPNKLRIHGFGISRIARLFESMIFLNSIFTKRLNSGILELRKSQKF